MLRRYWLLLLPLIFSGCSGTDVSRGTSATYSEQNKAHYKVGTPYRIDRKWYYPKENPYYKEEGIASWYGSEFHKKPTANGEVFNKNIPSAAHRTLPMPSMVRVTNLENGKSLLLRMNDRGPFAHDRILDLSEKAAKMLGVYEPGTARVRVEFDREETAKLFSSGSVSGAEDALAVLERLEKHEDVAEGTGHFIQTGAYSSYKNAQKQAHALRVIKGAVHIQKVDYPDRTLYRVRIGPYDDVDEADEMLNDVVRRGYVDAIITKN